ncbi:MAG: hypothetical protein ABJE66_20445 [Deltaproteobacteria bacterium]
MKDVGIVVDEQDLHTVEHRGTNSGDGGEHVERYCRRRTNAKLANLLCHGERPRTVAHGSYAAGGAQTEATDGCARISGEGVPMLIATFATMFGGLVIPLPLFPDWLKPVLYALPFAGVLDLPARVFTGDRPVAQGGLVIAHQLASHVLMPVHVGILLWVGLYLRDERVRGLVLTS